MMRPTVFHCGLLVALVALVGQCGQSAFGELAATAYRRILVPADNPASWPRGDSSLLPIEASDFERSVALINEPAPRARIVIAEYSARLAENRLVDARGWWQIECASDRSAWISLDSCSLKFQDTRWRDADTSAARIGWSLSKGSGKLVHRLEVPQDGTLDFSWHSVMGSASDEPQTFRFDLPISNQTRLVLDLPAFRRPLVESSVVLTQPKSEDQGGRWTLALAPRISHELRIENTRRNADSDTGKSVRQRCHFDVQRTGIELQSRVSLSSTDTPPRALQIRLPSGYQLASAKCNGLELDWRVQSQAIDRNRVAVDLPAATRFQKMDVDLVAWTPFSAGIEQQISFPQVEGWFWNSGEILVEVDESLQLCQAEAVDCVQTKALSLDASLRGGRSLHYSAYSSSAAVNCVFRHRPALGAVQTGVSLELTGAQTVGQVVSRIEIQRGSIHRLSAELSGSWIVDSVESSPVDAVGEWYVDKSAFPHSLHLQLRNALTSEDGIDVIVNARCASATSNAIPANKLIPLRWRELRSTSPIMQLRSGDQFELAIDGPWDDVDESSLSNTQRTLLTPDKFARTARADDLDRTMIRLIPRQIAYDATIRIDAILAGNDCALEYRLACAPQGGGIDHALIYFARPPEQSLAWHEVETGRRFNAEKVLESDPRLGGLPAGGQMWRLEFGRQYAREVNIAATQSVDWHEHSAIPIIALPDAATQQGRMTIATRDVVPVIRYRNLAPAPFPIEEPSSSGDGDAAKVFAAYRFQPTRFYDSAATPKLELQSGHSAASSASFITRLDIDSCYASNGVGKHRVVFEMDGDASSPVDLQFPRGFVTTAAECDRIPIATQNTNNISIPVSNKPFHRVILEVASRGSPLKNGCQLVPPVPQGKCVVLAGEWSVRLPEGYCPQDAASEQQATYRERLFGSFARRDGHLFNPLSPRDWNLLWASATGWFTSSAQAASVGESPGDRRPVTNGSKTYRFSLGAARPAMVSVSHDQVTTAVGISLFIACAVGSQLARVPLRWKAWLGLTAAALSLILPGAWASLAMPTAWGFAAAVAWNCLQFENRTRNAAASLVILAATFPGVTFGAPSNPGIESVLVPVDADRKQVGTKYFVSTDFLQQLLTATARRDCNWMLREMRCEGTLVPASSQKPIGSAWQLTCELDSAARDVDVELPLERSEAKWSQTATVDGIPARLNWKAGGHGCTIRVPEPGSATISIPFAPIDSTNGPRPRVRLTLPPMRGAKIMLQGPREIEALHGKSVSFSRRNIADRSTWYGELGEDGVLEFEWSFDEARHETGESKRPICLLQLLQIGHDGLKLELVLAQRGEVEWPETLALYLEDGWRHEASNVLDLKPLITNAAQGRRAFEISIPPDARSMKHLRLRFVADSASPWGRVCPPFCDITSVDRTDCWLAVLWDSTVECRASEEVVGRPGLPAVLAAALNLDDRRSPTIVTNRDQLGSEWYLSVRPVSSRSTVRDRLSIAAGRDRFRINYRMDVVPQGADKFGWSISVPPDLNVESVAVWEGHEPVPVEWTCNGDTQVNTLFSRPLDKPYRVELLGDLPMPPDGNLPVPRISGADGNRRNQIVALYREDNVAAEWQFAVEPPWVEGGASLTAPFEDRTQFVQAFTADAASEGNARVAVDRREPQVSGTALTRLSRGKVGWEAVWKCNLQVEQGALDSLQIEAPTEWNGPFEVSPTASIQAIVPLASRGTNRIALRLSRQARTGDTIRLAIRSTLATVEGQQVSAPWIRITTAGRRTDYLSLPTSLDGEPISWTRSGLEPEELPPVFLNDDQAPASLETYRLVGDSLKAALRAKFAVNETASIRMAETTAIVRSDGGLLEVTRFLVSPAGLTRCIVNVPSGRRLARINVEGNPALVRQIAPRRFEVQFRHPQLPQTLDLATLSETKISLPAERIVFCQPVLEESNRAMAIALSLWTLRGDLNSHLPQTQGVAAVSPAQLAALRLDWWNGVSQRASSAVLDAPAVDGYSWLIHWSKCLQSVVRLAKRAGEASADSPPVTRVSQPEGNSAVHPINQATLWIEQFAELFATSADLLVADQTMDEAIEPGSVAMVSNGSEICFVSDGGSGRLEVQFSTPVWSALQNRYLAILPLVALATATWWLSRQSDRVQFTTDWPEAWVLTVGLVIWYFSRLSPIGMVIAIVSAVFLARRIVIGRKSPRHDSSKLPNSIPEEMA